MSGMPTSEPARKLFSNHKQTSFCFSFRAPYVLVCKCFREGCSSLVWAILKQHVGGDTWLDYGQYPDQDFKSSYTYLFKAHQNINLPFLMRYIADLFIVTRRYQLSVHNIKAWTMQRYEKVEKIGEGEVLIKLLAEL